MKTLFCNLWKGEGLPAFSENAYGPADVLRLWRGMKRHVSDARLVVLTDEHYFDAVNEAIRDAAQLEQYEGILGTCAAEKYEGYGCGGWTNVMEVFRPDLFERYIGAKFARGVVVGLDTVFVRNSDWLWEWADSPVGLPVDPYDSDVPCDAVVTFDMIGAHLAWSEHLRAASEVEYPHRLFGKPSEMVLLQHLWRLNNWTMLEASMEKLVSYKGKRLAESGAIPPRATVVYFHGRPKPWEIDSGHPVYQEWVR